VGWVCLKERSKSREREKERRGDTRDRAKVLDGDSLSMLSWHITWSRPSPIGQEPEQIRPPCKEGWKRHSLFPPSLLCFSLTPILKWRLGGKVCQKGSEPDALFSLKCFFKTFFFIQKKKKMAKRRMGQLWVETDEAGLFFRWALAGTGS